MGAGRTWAGMAIAVGSGGRSARRPPEVGAGRFCRTAQRHPRRLSAAPQPRAAGAPVHRFPAQSLRRTRILARVLIWRPLGHAGGVEMDFKLGYSARPLLL